MAFDEAARIPMIMHWPNGLPRNIVWHSGTSLVDIAPTILSATGINTKEPRYGDYYRPGRITF